MDMVVYNNNREDTGLQGHLNQKIDMTGKSDKDIRRDEVREMGRSRHQNRRYIRETG